MSRTRCVRVLKAEKREEDGEAREEEDMGEEDVKLVVETVAGCHKENKNLSIAIFCGIITISVFFPHSLFRINGPSHFLLFFINTGAFVTP